MNLPYATSIGISHNRTRDSKTYNSNPCIFPIKTKTKILGNSRNPYKLQYRESQSCKEYSPS